MSFVREDTISPYLILDFINHIESLMSAKNNQSSGCLTVLLRLFSGNNNGRDTGAETKQVYPYRVRDDFLSQAERSFYGVLKLVVADRAIIMSKVGLWDIFYVAQPNENRGAKAHIDRKHVDFLLCDPQAIQPILGIELDDKSHQREDRQERDAAVDAVFEVAGLPLLHISVGHGYDTNDLVQKLAPYLGESQLRPKAVKQETPLVALRTKADEAPTCPKCGTPMVIRVASQGENKGKRFYACPNYPKCKSVIPVE